ncbi:sodium-and chloride-dependent glycine transporter 1 [Plakobranchus ocellatus]|uniref:Sodium-and chloride-dependent glycine transporter 1 n=1 Tax=Plakobranchus ocellatus TaxID=259542 RepID=A0AAV4DU09_9GAST|nr:sodium-and chloride-dependent glycine transporter 1 [Plakobranchus ocellatus]
MSSEIPHWNAVQFVIICVYTCFLSFFQSPHGGLSVVAVYISLLVLGIPVIFVQLKLGSYLQTSMLSMFTKFFPIWKGLGYTALIDLYIMLVTYAPLVAQLGTYAFIAIAEDDYLWSDCNKVKHFTQKNEMCSVNKPLRRSMGQTPRRPEELFYTIFDGVSKLLTRNLRKERRDRDREAIVAAVLFLLGPGAVCCLLTVLGYGYHHLDNDDTVEYLKNLYVFKDSDDEHIFTIWTDSFKLLTYTFPLWTAICCTMGKLCGRSRKLRNLTWVMMLVVFLLVSQLPNLAMAPFLGNLYKKKPDYIQYSYGLGRLMWQMPAAFTELNVPKAYALVFFISAFLFSFMFLCVGTLTIVDNIVDAIKKSLSCQSCNRITISIFVTFIVAVSALGIGSLQTMEVGHYVFLLITQSMDKLRYPYIFLLGVGLLVVYVKQNFGLIERIVMGCWFSVACIVCSAIWQYDLYDEWDKNSNRVSYDELSWPRSGYFPGDEWTWVSWSLAAFPYVGILLGTIHACFTACHRGGSPVDEEVVDSSCCRKLCCGTSQRVREQTGDDFGPPPLLPSEPSAPPYMYSYMENGGGGGGGGNGRGDDHYHMDHYKLDYDPPESEPLTHHDRSTRI